MVEDIMRHGKVQGQAGGKGKRKDGTEAWWRPNKGKEPKGKGKYNNRGNYDLSKLPAQLRVNGASANDE